MGTRNRNEVQISRTVHGYGLNFGDEVFFLGGVSYKALHFESNVIYAQTMNDVTFAISVKVQLLLSFKIAVICAFFQCLRTE